MVAAQYPSLKREIKGICRMIEVFYDGKCGLCSKEISYYQGIAPVGIFVFINRSMGYPQWSDLGMFVQSVLLLAKENNLDTCAQESWAVFHKIVHKQVKAPKEYMLFCGIAIGHMDKTNVVNKIKTERANIDDLAEFFGFED